MQLLCNIMCVLFTYSIIWLPPLPHKPLYAEFAKRAIGWQPVIAGV